MKDGKIVEPDIDAFVERDAAAIDRVKQRDRHPELADALLRCGERSAMACGPAVRNAAYRDADAAFERFAEGCDLRLERLRRRDPDSAGRAAASGLW